MISSFKVAWIVRFSEETESDNPMEETPIAIGDKIGGLSVVGFVVKAKRKDDIGLYWEVEAQLHPPMVPFGGYDG